MNVTAPTLKGTIATLQVGAADVLNSKHEALDRSKRIATLDDRMAGSMLANEVMAYAKGEQNKWRGFAVRIIGFNAEAREAFLNAMKADKTAMTKTQVEFGIDGKTAKKTTSSFGVQVSKLSIIAKAFNKGATVTGWREYVNVTMAPGKKCDSDEEMMIYGGFEPLVAYCRSIAGSKAGRAADTWTVKLNKWLESNPVGEDAPKAEQDAFNAIVAIYNKLAA